jgi:hypothetical protein
VWVSADRRVYKDCKARRAIRGLKAFRALKEMEGLLGRSVQGATPDRQGHRDRPA